MRRPFLRLLLLLPALHPLATAAQSQPATSTSTALPQYQTTGPETTTLVDKTPIVLRAPFPFVEASHILIDEFAKLNNDDATAPNPSRLLAWYVSKLALKNLLNEQPGRFRALKVEVMKEMEPVHYEAADLQKMRADHDLAKLATIDEGDVDAVFMLLDLNQFEKKAGGLKFLGVSNLGPDSFTVSVAKSVVGSDLGGGRPIEASVICSTYILISGKILLLYVGGVELSANELGNCMRLTRDWITLLRAANNMK